MLTEKGVKAKLRKRRAKRVSNKIGIKSANLTKKINKKKQKKIGKKMNIKGQRQKEIKEVKLTERKYALGLSNKKICKIKMK